MKRTILTLIVTCFTLAASSQDAATNELKTLTDARQYDKMIKKYGARPAGLSAKALYYVGQAYYMRSDDNNCIKFMDLSIEKDKNDAASYYLKGSTLNYMKRSNEAIQALNEAIRLNPEDAQFYCGLGDAYYDLGKNEPALEAYRMATRQSQCPDHGYAMVAQIYFDMKRNDEALQAYYAARSKIEKGSRSYLNAIYNIGVLESLKGDYDKAETSFLELIRLDATDHNAYAKLVQVYYHREEYDKAKPYKDKIYEAHKKGVLQKSMQDMFCIDQFRVDDKLIQAYERYESGKKSEIYIKHLFYVMDKNDNIQFVIQTEYSPVSVEQGGSQYLLCMRRDKKHSTFDYGFNEPVNYSALKKAVLEVLDGKRETSASSVPGN